jgi:hypothetical protein
LRIGLISNTHSGRNRKALPKIRAILAARPWVLHREARTPEQIAEALDEFARAGVEVVALNGGDGTIQSALTHLFAVQPFKTMPLLALLPGGTTNMSAYDISGGRRRLLPSLHRLLGPTEQSGGDWKTMERSLLKVRARPEAEPLFGLFFGAGAIIRGMEYFQAQIHSKGLKNEIGPGLTLLRFLWGVLRGDPAFIGGSPVVIGVDREDPKRGFDSLILFVSTLERLFLGMHPYWGKEGGPMHFTLIEEHPGHLLRAFIPVVRGRPGRYVTEAEGYHSHNITTLQLLLDGRFSLDGELYEARSEWGPIILESGQKARFIRL